MYIYYIHAIRWKEIFAYLLFIVYLHYIFHIEINHRTAKKHLLPDNFMKDFSLHNL